MGRPRTFEIDAALEAATQAFWEKGYEATSMADLMAVTGLGKGSIYKAWADKRALFQAVLRRYLDRGYTRLAALAEGEPEDALAALLGHMTSTCGNDRRGCLALNTVVELGPHDAEAAELLNAHQTRVARLVAGVVRRGQRAGTLRADRKPDDLAHFLLAVATGAVTRSKGSLSAARARASIDLALEALR